MKCFPFTIKRQRHKKKILKNMPFLLRVYHLLILSIWTTETLQVPDDLQWGKTCPVECQCEIKTATETLISRWKDENSLVKSALCVFKNDSLDLIIEVPNDTESITFLQADDDDTVMIFTHNILKSIPKVKSIDMQGSLSNATTYITNDVFHDLPDLKYLSLQRVDITGTEKAFTKLSSLEVLYVIHCIIDYLKWEMLDGLKNLKELYLLQSGIKELYGFAFYGTPELRRLFLSHNDLFSVEADAFVGLLKLEYLDLSNNQIDHLSGLTFPPLPHLQWLELKHNPIKVIFPHCFRFLNGTQHLTLGHKQQPVHLMKFSFRGLYSLIFLHIPNIDNDALIEHMFYDLSSLTHLKLQGRIKVINNKAFNGAHKLLKKLILHNCKLEKVYEDAFYGLEELHLLDLSSNFLLSLSDGTFRYLKSIQDILLHNNRFIQISDELFLILPTLKVATLYNNPWNCTCKMKNWKKEIAMNKYIEFEKICNQTNDCSDNYISESDVDLAPRCEYPQYYKDENVFKTLELLACD